ncbi:MAG: hypothetical protein ACYDC2_13485, partial [Solirubrobacteraceae bacterium]
MVLQVRTAGALVCSLIVLGSGTGAAQAANTGGAAAASPTTPAAAGGSSRPALHLFRVTSRSSNVAYHGPVFVKTPSGEVVPYTATAVSATTGTAASATGGAPAGAAQPSATIPSATIGQPAGPTARPQLLVPGTTARYVNGLAAAPMGAPAAVQEIVWAGNELIGLPYVYGGGHGSFTSAG